MMVGDDMNIVINPKNLTVSDEWQIFYKVRAVIKNKNGEYAISTESGKCIFPGGKCENGESPILAIKRELFEELGIEFLDEQLEEKFILETFYDDYYDFRIKICVPRYTKTIYFYGETKEDIDFSKMNLTKDEINQKFKCFFVSKDELIKMINIDHSLAFNGKYFDLENKIVMDNIINM